MSRTEKFLLPLCTLLAIGLALLFNFAPVTRGLLIAWIVTAALLYFVARNLQFFITVAVVKNKARRKELFATSTTPADVVMLGDSITHEGLWHEYFPRVNILNRGIGGDTTQNILDRLDAIYPLRPQQLFLLIGINDLNMGRKREHTLRNYAALLDALRQHLPDTQVLLQSVLPVSADWKLARNADVLALNERIKAFAGQRGLTYIELNAHFCDARGELRAELSNDGIHLGPHGYALWCDHIRSLMNSTATTA